MAPVAHLVSMSNFEPINKLYERFFGVNCSVMRDAPFNLDGHQTSPVFSLSISYFKVSLREELTMFSTIFLIRWTVYTASECR